MGRTKSYMNQVWCPFYDECENGDECKRALTPDTRIDAGKAGAPIKQYEHKPVCFEEWSIEDGYDSWYDYEFDEDDYEFDEDD